APPATAPRSDPPLLPARLHPAAAASATPLPVACTSAPPSAAPAPAPPPAEFRFDPQAVVPEPELRSVVLKYKQLEEGLRTQLQRGATELEAMAGRTEEQLRAALTRIEALVLRV